MAKRPLIDRIPPTPPGIKTSIIVGCDGSLRGTGMASITFESGGRDKVTSLYLPTKKKEGDDALRRIHVSVETYLQLTSHDPGVFCIEENVFSRGRNNPKTTIAQAEAIGAIIAAAASLEWMIVRVKPSEAKAALAMSGNASKETMRRWARLRYPELFQGKRTEGYKEAVADAVGIAIAGDRLRAMADQRRRYDSATR